MFERFHQLTGVELFDSIGSSEITYEWIANRPKEFKRGSLGKPVFGYEVRLVGPDGSDVTEPGVSTCRSTRMASSGSAGVTTICSRSRACGCRRSTSRRR
jgi:acyl-coenzyme A synthetase/AMP-(fatty) acid ligase